MDKVRKELDGGKTKAGRSIKITAVHSNLIRVMVNGYMRQVVILPLGICNLSGKIKTHTVEDYILEDYSVYIPATKGDSSKEILRGVVDSQGLDQSKIDTSMLNGIQKHSPELQSYLEPL